MKTLVSVEVIDNYYHILIKNENEVIRIIPIYLNYGIWAEEFDRLYSHLGEVYSENMFIIGDLNARTGENQEISEDIIGGSGSFKESRNSEDKELNPQGRKLLDAYRDYSMVICNGRCEGDYEGKMTFVSTSGSSLIDYCLVGSNGIQFVKKLCIGPPLHSDHLPLELKLVLNSNQDLKSSHSKIKWVSQKQNWYITEILNVVSQVREDEGLENVSIDSIIGQVKNIGERMCNGRKQKFKEKWFNEKCEKARVHSFHLFQNWRRNRDSDLLRRLYIESNKRYKDICKSSKEIYFKNKCDELRSIKSAEDWWSWVNNFRNCSSNKSGNITIEDFKLYFNWLLKASEEHSSISTVAPLIEDEYLDSDFTLEEFKMVLAKLKDNKAPGEDRVPVEFLKYAPDELLDFILTFINKSYATIVSEEWSNRSLIIPLYKKRQ